MAVWVNSHLPANDSHDLGEASVGMTKLGSFLNLHFKNMNINRQEFEPYKHSGKGVGAQPVPPLSDDIPARITSSTSSSWLAITVAECSMLRFTQ